MVAYATSEDRHAAPAKERQRHPPPQAKANPVINGVVTAVRFVFALPFTPLVVFLAILAVPIETVGAVVYVLSVAVFLQRGEINGSWVASWPNSIQAGRRVLRRTWEWVFFD